MSQIVSRLKELNGSIETQSSSITESSAAIESAHAGAAGQEFAVVADEIRKLAVKNAMDEQNEGNKQVLESMKHISDSTILVKNNSDEIMDGTDHLVKEMNVLSEVTGHITDSMKVMTRSIENITSAVKLVNDNSAKNLNDSHELSGKIETFSL